MADIKIVCAKCGKETNVSEFASFDNLTCKCGERLRKPMGSLEAETEPKHAHLTIKSEMQAAADREAPPQPKSRAPVLTKMKHHDLTFKTEEQVVSEHGSQAEPEEWGFNKATAVSAEDRKESKNIHMILSWSLFLALGGLSYYARYGGHPAFATYLPMLQQYGIALFITLYVAIILKAFKDTVFQGLLCLIPGYPFYYMITICDDFYFRAVVFGVMPAIGQDSGEIINTYSQQFINAVHAWIQTGG